MATYSSRLRLTLPATGEYVNSWGTVVNDGITALLDDSISGTSAITIAGTDYTLTSVNGSTDEARRMFIVATGTPGAARNVICPAVTKLYSITNNTTGGFALTLKTSAGSGISVPNGATMLLKCDGTNVVQAASTFTDITYTTTLTGGTGIVNLGSGQFYKDASGNVGVGVTPTSYGAGYTTLAVNGSTAGVLDLMSGGVSQFRLFSATATENRLQGVTNVPMTFYTNNTEKMRLDASGRLLIGRTSQNATAPKMSVEGRIDSVTTGSFASTFGSSSSAPFVLSESSTGTEVERMRIDNNGNMVVSAGAAGVGTTSSVKGVQIRFDATNNIGYIQSTQSGVANYPLALNGTENRFLIGGTEAMRLDASGNQINTPSNTPPTLTVNGQMNLTPTSNTNMRISYRGSDGVTRVANITLA